jgi:hypothetical protein
MWKVCVSFKVINIPMLKINAWWCFIFYIFFIIWFVRLLALRPLLAYCASLGAIMKMIVEKQMDCRLTGETEVLGENLPQRHFCLTS